MKTYKSFVIGLLAVASLTTGCKDSFLEVTPGTKSTLEEYFSTEDRIFEAVVAAYSPMRQYDWNNATYNPLNICSEVMSDNFWAGGADLNDYSYWHKMENFEATPMYTLDGIWTQSYRGIKRAIDVFGYIESAKDNLSTDFVNLTTEECKVLIGFYYLQLWKFYGHIPVYFENLRAPYTCEQSSDTDAYNAIIAYLEEALALDALPMKWDNDNCGRISKATAYMIYADFVMYAKDTSRYSTALKYMQEIISGGQYSLNSDYAQLWKTEGEFCDESIFEIAYSDGPLGKRSYNDGYINVGGTWLPRVISPSGGVAADGVDNGWGAAPVRDDALAKFDDADARKEATCYVAPEGSYKARYQDTGIWLNKYIARSENLKDIVADGDGNYNNNLRLYRYAETLLNAAELIVNTGGNTTEALNYLNQVHKRAGLPALTEVNIDNIINERDLEFMGEGKRYFDLVRTGKAASVLKPYSYRTNTWSENRKYVPIPQSEIDAAQGTLQQVNY